MKIAILGAGNSGCALAADYAGRGHEVTLIKTSHSLHDDNFRHLTENGQVMVMDEFGDEKICKINRLTREISEAAGHEVVLLCTQTGFHREVLKRVVPYLEAGQVMGYVAEPTKYYSVEGSNIYFQLEHQGTKVNPLDYFE